MADIPDIPDIPWSDMTPAQKYETVTELFGRQRMSAMMTARALGISRNAVIAAVHRAMAMGYKIDTRGARKTLRGNRTGNNQYTNKPRVPKPKPAPKATKPRPRRSTIWLGFNHDPRYTPETGEQPASPRQGAFDPLAGTTPAPLEARRGCAWPVGNGAPFMFCDAPVKEGRSWCPAHDAMGHIPGSGKTASLKMKPGQSRGNMRMTVISGEWDS